MTTAKFDTHARFLEHFMPQGQAAFSGTQDRRGSITKSYPRNAQGNPLPAVIINSPLVVDGQDCFLAFVDGGLLTFAMESIRVWASEGLPLSIKEA